MGVRLATGTLVLSLIALGASSVAAQAAPSPARAPLEPAAQRCVANPSTACSDRTFIDLRLPGRRLVAADFSASSLRGANLVGTRLVKADLRGANLNPAANRGRRSPTILNLAHLRGADLSGASLHHAVLQGANLRNARLRHARLRGAIATAADLRGADLRRAGLGRTNLDRADLRNADLSDAILRHTRLERANLRGASFAGATLYGVTLLGARGLDLRGARICRTVLPNGRISDRDCARPITAAEGIQDPGGPRTPSQRPALLAGERERRAVAAAAGTGGRSLSTHRTARGPSPRCSPNPGTDCAYFDLNATSWNDIDVAHSDFWMTQWDDATVTNSNFTGAFLAWGNFTGANLTGSTFDYINPGLEPSTPTGLFMNSANLTNTSFRYANLKDAQLSFANLSGADLSYANLSNANLYGANLTGANLTGAILYGTQFTQANATQANFTGVYMYGASMSGTNLSGAYLGALIAPMGSAGGSFPYALDASAWTCYTTLPDGTSDMNDCDILANLMTQIAASFGAAGLGTAISSATANILDTLSGTAEQAAAYWGRFAPGIAGAVVKAGRFVWALCGPGVEAYVKQWLTSLWNQTYSTMPTGPPPAAWVWGSVPPNWDQSAATVQNKTPAPAGIQQFCFTASS